MSIIILFFFRIEDYKKVQGLRDTFSLRQIYTPFDHPVAIFPDKSWWVVSEEDDSRGPGIDGSQPQYAADSILQHGTENIFLGRGTWLKVEKILFVYSTFLYSERIVTSIGFPSLKFTLSSQ